MRKVAVVGGGQIFETVHLKAINNIGDVQLVAICEPNVNRANELRTICPNVNIYNDIDQMLEIETLDEAVVSVPNLYHYETTVKLLNHKVNVLCEKPPAINAQEAKIMHEMAQQNNVKLYYNFHLRQKKIIHDLDLTQTDIYHVDIKANRRRGIPGWGNFINKELQGGGALIDLGIHYLDLFFAITNDYNFNNIFSYVDDYIGKHEHVGDFGKWDNKKFNVENFCSAVIQNKYLINLETSFAHNIDRKDDYKLIIYTHQGRVDVLEENIYDINNKLTYNNEKVLDQEQLRIKSSEMFLTRTYTNMCDSYQGFKIQEVVEQIYNNAKEQNE